MHPTGARLHVVFPPGHHRVVELGEALTIGRAVPDGLSLDVPSLSRTHLNLKWDPALHRHRAHDTDSRYGTMVNGQPLGDAPVPLGHNAVLRAADLVLVYELSPPFRAVEPTLAVIGGSVGAHRVRDGIARAATDFAPVLISGEAGVGKRTVAREIHRLSGRAGPLLAISCATTRPQLLEGQLFGYVREPFTSTDATGAGLFRAASGGTLLLDDVGALPQELQPKLLHALRQGLVLAMGAKDPVRVDVRLVATTTTDLRASAGRGAFDGELYAHLAIHEVHVPPLRERRADTLAWVGLFDRELRAQQGLSRHLELEAEAAEGVLLGPLKENLRSLSRLVLELAALPEGHDEVTVADLPPWLIEEGHSSASRPAPSRDELASTLKRLGSVRATARFFEKDRRAIYRMIEALDVDWTDEGS